MRTPFRLVLFTAPLLVALAACGVDAAGPAEEPTGAPAPSPPGTGPGLPTEGASPVQPRPPTTETHPVEWEGAEVADDDVTVTVTWWSGVEPCAVLDRVEVAEATDAVTITVHEGADPDEPDAICPMIAVLKSTVVTLEAPLAGRELRDGAG